MADMTTEESLKQRIVNLEAQVFKMAEWLLVERSIAAEGVGDWGVIGKAFRERIAEIDALLSGSAGESYLCDLQSDRDKALADAAALREALIVFHRHRGDRGEDVPCLGCVASAGLGGEGGESLLSRLRAAEAVCEAARKYIHETKAYQPIPSWDKMISALAAWEQAKGGPAT